MLVNIVCLQQRCFLACLHRSALPPPAAVTCAVVTNAEVSFYVNCEEGSDGSSGSSSSPWKTLGFARDFIRTLQPLNQSVSILIQPGDCYPIDATTKAVNFSLPILELLPTDSGVSKSITISYEAVTPGTVRFISGAPVTPTLWTSNGGSTVSLDLLAAGIAPYGYGRLGSGGLGQCTNNQMELFFGDTPMLLARYPNIATNGSWQYMTVAHVVTPLSFIVNDTRPLLWGAEPDIWLHGFWSFDWADNYVHVVSISASGTGALITIDPNTPPLYGILNTARFVAVNLVSEIDAPGEYAFNASSHNLTFYPPSPIASSEAFLSIGPASVTGGAAAAAMPHMYDKQADGSFRRLSTLEMQERGGVVPEVVASNGLSFVTFSGFSVLYSRGTAFTITDGTSIIIDGVNASNHGHNGVSLNGYNNTFSNSVVIGTGCQASSVSGGNTETLTPGNNIAINNVISNYARMCRTYQPGIGWGGVGNLFEGNSISNAPHNGFLGGGNNNIFKSNTLSDLCYEVSDSGAWYAGRSWVARGNVIVNNTFIRINNTEGYGLGSPSVQAIYLDDQLSGQTIVGNTFIDCVKGAFIGGGRDNFVGDNTCINTGYCVHVDNRGMNWQAASCAYNATYAGALVQQMFAVNYTSPPYSTAYPEMVTTLSNHPCVPVNMTITGNRYCVGPATQGFMDVTTNQTQSWFDSVSNNTQFAC